MAKFKINYATDGDKYPGIKRTYIDDNIRGKDLIFYHVASQNSVAFRAMLKNFSENFDPAWEGEKTIGRMDDIPKYSNTTRKIDVSFQVPAESDNEAIYNMGKLGALIRLLYPTYDKPDNFATTISASPIVRVRFANLICKPLVDLGSEVKFSGLLGRISGFKWTPDNNLGYMNNYIGEMHPRLFDISFNFTIIHEHQLGWDSTTKKPMAKEFEYFPHNIGVNRESEDLTVDDWGGLSGEGIPTLSSDGTNIIQQTLGQSTSTYRKTVEEEYQEEYGLYEDPK